MTDLLQTDTFRDQVKNFIQANIKAYCKGVRSKEDLNRVKTTPNLGWYRAKEPMHGRAFWAEYRKRQQNVARSKQIHTCKPAACLVQGRGNQAMRCKRKAPWPCSEVDFVLPNGEWGPKRGYGYVNAWNPVLANALGCNHDCKILTNGQDSCKITYYCTCYAAKKQKRSHNVSALLARSYAFEHRDDVDTRGIQDANRLLVMRCVDSLNREQELAAPLVMSHLMGWGDVYKSHKFVNIFWSVFLYHLFDSFPALDPLVK
jgi:hypothetical protein